MTETRKHPFVPRGGYSTCGHYVQEARRGSMRPCALPPSAEVHREATCDNCAPCPHEAWEEIGGGRTCSDCRADLGPAPQPEAKEERTGRWTQAEWRQVLSHFKTAQELSLLVEELLAAAFAGREK